MFNPHGHLFDGRHVHVAVMWRGVAGWRTCRRAAGRLDVVSVVLAAGAGSRFRGPGHKLDAAVVRSPRLERAVAAALAAGRRAGDRRHRRAGGDGAAPVGRPRRQRAVGRRSDHVAARRHRRRRELGATAVVVGLGDQPFVSLDAWRAVAATDAPIAVATYDGRRGHPVRLRHDVWDLLPADGDEGARTLMRLRPDLVTAVPCDGSPIDIDTVEDLRRWQTNSSTSSP